MICLKSAGKVKPSMKYYLGVDIGGTKTHALIANENGQATGFATGGDTYLGGEDFDNRIIQLLADHFQKESGGDVRQDKMALQRL